MKFWKFEENLSSSNSKYLEFEMLAQKTFHLQYMEKRRLSSRARAPAASLWWERKISNCFGRGANFATSRPNVPPKIARITRASAISRKSLCLV